MHVDRPLGSNHPRHSSITYTVNYGYVPETLAADGEEIDAYLLGVDEPLSHFEGTCIAILRRENDIEDKLILARKGEQFTDDEILEQTQFQEKYFISSVVR